MRCELGTAALGDEVEVFVGRSTRVIGIEDLGGRVAARLGWVGTMRYRCAARPKGGLRLIVLCALLMLGVSGEVSAVQATTSGATWVTVADAVDPRPLHFSLRSAATVGGVSAANEDIVSFNGTTGFSLVQRDDGLQSRLRRR